MDRRKRKRRGEPTRLYKRDGIFYARVTVDGLEHRQSLKTSDRAEAERRLEKWLEGKSPYKGTIRHTFLEAAALWLEAGEWKPKTLKGYVKLLGPLEEYFKGHYWDQVDKAALQAFADFARQPKPHIKGHKGAGTATINRYFSVISGIADHVRELPGWPELNPVSLLPKKPRKVKKWHYVRPPAADVEAYFARMKGTFGDLCRFALLTGARMDEIAQLKADNVAGDTARLWDTKSGFRTIGLSPAALEIAKRQPASKEGYLFITRNGKPYKRVTEMWREVVDRAQNLAQREGRTLTRMRFHDLRHEYAIRELENGRSIYLLKEHLGHSTVGQTEDYLRYLTPESAASAKNRTAQ